LFYTYSHSIPNGRIFYIGKGQGNRAYSLKNRNQHWQRIVEKHGKPIIEILANWDTEEEAFSHEMLLISCFKDMGYTLANKTNGGEGQSGMTPWNKGKSWDLDTKEKISLMRKGIPAWNKGIPLTEECKQKMSASLAGRPAWNKGVECRPETKQKLREKLVGKQIHSEEFKQKMRTLHTGNKWNLGRPASEKQRQTASKRFKGNKHAEGNTNQRKWVWVGTNIKTGEVIRLVGEQALKDASFQHANIIKCINGTRKSHKGYTWTKELIG
jgi:NUMOD3 motif